MSAFLIIIIIFIILMILIGLGIGLYFLLRHKTNTSGSSGDSFSISPETNSTLFLMSGNPDDRNDLYVRVSSDTNISCSSYSWTKKNGSLVSDKYPTLNLLKVCAGIFSCSPPKNIQLGINGKDLWNYNTVNKTWCTPADSGGDPETCLYFNSDNSVTSNVYNSTDPNFRWNNVSVTKNCS